MVTPLPESLRTRLRAFSLIETVIAMGIVGFAFVGIVGLLPCGLQVFRKAMDATAKAQMVQHLVGEAGRMSANELEQMGSTSFSFDENGNAVAADSPASLYVAEVSLRKHTTMPGTVSFNNPELAGLSITFRRKQEENATSPLGTVVTYIAAGTGLASP